MIGTKLYKENLNDEEYANLACWCNENNATIEDKGEFFECVEIPPYIPTPEEIKKQLTDGVQRYMDETAQTRGYDNIHTACSYVNSTDAIFAQEGAACLAWRDQVWRTCYNILDQVMNGDREVPSLEELIEELPVLNWENVN
jgi:hypothetical protein